MTDRDETKDSSLAALSNFDQTNGVVEGLEGDSDGTAEGEDHSAGERAESEIGDGSLGQVDDSSPADHFEDGVRDPNP